MKENEMHSANGRWVEIAFDCLPLRSVARTDVPLDASPKLAQKMLRVKSAIEKHGALNTYYLHNATCKYHLTNDASVGMVQYEFEGVMLTDSADLTAIRSDLRVSLQRETCGWLNQAIVDWLAESVRHSVLVEFNRYIHNGDLNKTIERVRQMEQESERSGGFVGMYL